MYDLQIHYAPCICTYFTYTLLSSTPPKLRRSSVPSGKLTREVQGVSGRGRPGGLRSGRGTPGKQTPPLSAWERARTPPAERPELPRSAPALSPSGSRGPRGSRPVPTSALAAAGFPRLPLRRSPVPGGDSASRQDHPRCPASSPVLWRGRPEAAPGGGACSRPTTWRAPGEHACAVRP